MSARPILLYLSIVIAATGAFAQDRGTIVGTITDSSGAAVTAATVVLRNPSIGFTQTVTSSQEVSYTFLYLPSGKYSVSVEKEGFRKAEAADIQVQVNTASRVDIRLQLGTVQEVVEVRSTAPLLQADRTDLGCVVDNRAIQKLPLFINGGLRSNLAFAALVPGVVMNQMCYGAGNVLDYENDDPLPDIRQCWRDVRAFAIKDHRNTPKDEDCGPGFGEIDHYKLLAPVAHPGRSMPLCCENIFEPLLRRPATPDGIDRLAQRAREFLETVTRGLQSATPPA